MMIPPPPFGIFLGFSQMLLVPVTLSNTSRHAFIKHSP